MLHAIVVRTIVESGRCRIRIKRHLDSIADGDEHARLVYKAMAYQVAQDIGAMAVVAKGKMDAIIITGGIAYSKMFTDWIKEYVEFLAPIVLVPGSMEMQALARGVNRVVNGEENANRYILGETVL